MEIRVNPSPIPKSFPPSDSGVERLRSYSNSARGFYGDFCVRDEGDQPRVSRLTIMELSGFGNGFAHSER
jgi:hypothetical protein